MLLLRLHALLLLRSLPEGGWARVRRGIVSIVGLALIVIAFRPTYTVIDTHVIHAAYTHDTGTIARTLAGISGWAGAAFFFFGTITCAQIVYTLDMRVFAATPVSPRLIMGAAALSMLTFFSLALCALTIPIVLALIQAHVLGWGSAIACLVIVLSMPALPFACGLLLSVVLLLFIPASRMRAIVSLLAPMISGTLGVTLRLVLLLAPRGAAGAMAYSLLRLWDISPFTWDGRALAAIISHEWPSALALAGETILLTIIVLAVASIGARDLLAAGLAAYTEDADTRRARPRRGLARPIPLATALVGPGARVSALSRRAPDNVSPRSGQRALLGKEWIIARRDGAILGRAAIGLYSMSGVMLAVLVGAAKLGPRSLRLFGRAHNIPSIVTLPILRDVIIDVGVVLSCGGLMVVLLDAAWSREMNARDILARTPLAPSSTVGCLGVFYVIPTIVLAVGLAALGTSILLLPPLAILSIAPVIAMGLVMLAALVLTANVVWPGPFQPNGGVGQSWIARGVATLSDGAITIFCATFILFDLVGIHHPLLIVVTDGLAVGLTAVIVALCRRLVDRELTRQYTRVAST